MNKIYEKVTANPEVVAMLIIVLVLGILGVCSTTYYIWQKNTDAESRLQQTMVLRQRDAQDKNVLQNKLELSNQNAEMLTNFVKQAQVGQVQPINYFTVQAPDLTQATQEVVDRINTKDTTLPPQALEKTDNTIVVPNLNKNAQANYSIAVFKNNNYRNWEWSIGYGVQDGNKYASIGLQRNYSKDKAIEAEVHLDPSNIKKVTGGAIKQVWKTDKLFYIF